MNVSCVKDMVVHWESIVNSFDAKMALQFKCYLTILICNDIVKFLIIMHSWVFSSTDGSHYETHALTFTYFEYNNLTVFMILCSGKSRYLPSWNIRIFSGTCGCVPSDWLSLLQASYCSTWYICHFNMELAHLGKRCSNNAGIVIK